MKTRNSIYLELINALEEHRKDNSMALSKQLTQDFPLENVDKSEIIFTANLKARLTEAICK